MELRAAGTNSTRGWPHGPCPEWSPLGHQQRSGPPASSPTLTPFPTRKTRLFSASSLGRGAPGSQEKQVLAPGVTHWVAWDESLYTGGFAFLM